ncbi:MAG: 3',5'-cyclic-AMP phosphodiesterase [Bermanella sp.]
MQKFIQITDCHLFAKPGGTLLGMDTQFSLDTVLQQMHQQVSDFDFFLCSGDLSQDGSIASYTRLKQQLEKDGKPQYWLPGNHDDRSNMLSVVSAQQEMVSVIKKGKWQIILLDSQVPGCVFGNLAQSQLDILNDALAADASSHTMLVMHHQPIPMGCEWIDNQQIKNGDALLAIVQRHPNVKVVLWGHVHQDSDREINGVRFISTPSTCVQFTPYSSDFGVDEKGPGYRWMELHDDGSIKTGVNRVEDIEFTVDYSGKGY